MTHRHQVEVAASHPIVDSHLHVWDLSRSRYEWLNSSHAPINRTMGMVQVAPVLREHGVKLCVLVQSADNYQDTELMIDVANESSQVAGVVAYLPLEFPDKCDELSSRWQDSIVVGTRSLTHDRHDAEWLLRADVSEGLSVLEDRGLALDVNAVLDRHLEVVPILAERHPRLKIVLDHLANPPVDESSRDAWWNLIGEAASAPNVYCKVSGLYPVAVNDLSATGAIRPYVERAVDVFGARRLMYGGNWPVSLLAGGYSRAWRILMPILDELAPPEREWVLGRTAVAFYGLQAR